MGASSLFNVWEAHFLYQAKLRSGSSFLIWKTSDLLNNLYM